MFCWMRSNGSTAMIQSIEHNWRRFTTILVSVIYDFIIDKTARSESSLLSYISELERNCHSIKHNYSPVKYNRKV